MVITIQEAVAPEEMADIAMERLESIVAAWQEGLAEVTQVECSDEQLRISLKTPDDKITTVTVEV